MCPKRVLFLSRHNAARSIMAEAVLRHLRPHTYEVYSAGLEPGSIDSRALTSLEHQNINTQGLYSKSLDMYRGEEFDYIIALCDKSHAEGQSFSSAGHLLLWDFQDPAKTGSVAEFAKGLKEIQQRIQMLLLVSEKQGRQH